MDENKEDGGDLERRELKGKHWQILFKRKSIIFLSFPFPSLLNKQEILCVLTHPFLFPCFPSPSCNTLEFTPFPTCNTPEFPTLYTEQKSQGNGGNSGVTLPFLLFSLLICYLNIDYLWNIKDMDKNRSM